MLIYNFVLVSGVQQSDSVKILFQILFHYSLLQDIEHSSMFTLVLILSFLIFLRKVQKVRQKDSRKPSHLGSKCQSTGDL